MFYRCHRKLKSKSARIRIGRNSFIVLQSSLNIPEQHLYQEAMLKYQHLTSERELPKNQGEQSWWPGQVNLFRPMYPVPILPQVILQYRYMHSVNTCTCVYRGLHTWHKNHWASIHVHQYASPHTGKLVNTFMNNSYAVSDLPRTTQA